MTTWVDRIKSRMKELELTQEELAQQLGITRGAVTHYLAGRRVPPLMQFQNLAAVLKSDPAWLQFGRSNKNTDHKQQDGKDIITYQIPILGCNQVSLIKQIRKLKRDQVTQWVPDIYTDKPHWYALRVQGDSMTSNTGNKSFHEDDIIIVDPDKEAKHGSFVIAILPDSNEATFKQYVTDGGKQYLKPLNSQYPLTQMNTDTHIFGCVVKHICSL